MIRYHCFISYTNRESELHELRPLLDAIGNAFRSFGVIEAPFFWDRFNIDAQCGTSELATKLLNAIHESVCMIALVSPSYVSSPWCIFEWGSMAGIHLNRGPKWPAIRPYIWRRIDSADHFVQQVPAKIIDIDFRILMETQPLPWKIFNPFAQHLHYNEKRKFSEFLGDVLQFIATKCTEMKSGLNTEFEPDTQRLFNMSKDLLTGRSIEDVVSRHCRGMMS